MTKLEYLTKAFNLLAEDKISAEVYDCMLMNIDEFTEDNEA